MVQTPHTPPTLFSRVLALARGTGPAQPTISSVALIIANLIPLWGVLFDGWDIFTIMLLYWTENLVVGVFNVLRMLTAQPTSVGLWVGKLFIVPFFCFHYGMFTFVHGVFVMAIFGNPAATDVYTNGHGLQGMLQLFYLLQDRTNHFFGVALAGLVISHGVSFVANYLCKGEYARVSLDTLMGRPYGRVILLHLTIIIGGGLAMMLGAPVMAVAVLVGLKIWCDLAAHKKEREKLGEGTTPVSSD